VPGVESGFCSCGNSFEIPRHILIHYKKEQVQREELRRVNKDGLDFKKLLNTPERVGITSRWIVYLGRLSQFSLARLLLYE